MPYANPLKKQAHNKQYQADNKLNLMITRLEKRLENEESPINIRQSTYDQIKDIERAQDLIQHVKIMKQYTTPATTTRNATAPAAAPAPAPAPAAARSTTRNNATATTNNNVSSQQPKTASSTAIRTFILNTPIISTEGTRNTYFNRINVLSKLICKKEFVYRGTKTEGDEFDMMCIFNKDSIEKLKQKYTNKNTLTHYLSTMLWMHDHITIIKNNADKDTIKSIQDFQKDSKDDALEELIEKADEEADNNDYDEDYKRMEQETHKILKKTSNFDNEYLISVLYRLSIFDDKGNLSIIPRNYYHNMRIVETESDIDDKYKNNYYVKDEGTMIINDYKTKSKGRIYYKINRTAKAKLSNVLKDKRQWMFQQKNAVEPIANTNVSQLITKTLTMSINLYRKVMKQNFQNKGMSLKQIANASKNSIQTGRTSYATTKTKPKKKPTAALRRSKRNKR